MERNKYVKRNVLSDTFRLTFISPYLEDGREYRDNDDQNNE